MRSVVIGFWLWVLTLSAFGVDTNRVYTVTAYCHCAKCCGKANQPAANGQMPVPGITVAGPREFRLGTRIRIEGVGERIIQDRTPKRFDDRIDVFMEDHEMAIKFGRKKLLVAVLN